MVVVVPGKSTRFRCAKAGIKAACPKTSLRAATAPATALATTTTTTSASVAAAIVVASLAAAAAAVVALLVVLVLLNVVDDLIGHAQVLDL